MVTVKLSCNGIILNYAVILISYPKEEFHDPKALRAFIRTDVSLSTDEILNKSFGARVHKRDGCTVFVQPSRMLVGNYGRMEESHSSFFNSSEKYSAKIPMISLG